MNGMRRAHKPGRISLLVLGLVFLRALVPAGFMLAPVDRHLSVVLCDGEATLPAALMPAGHHHAHTDHAAHQHGAHGDLTCPYANSSGPAPLPALPALAGGMACAHPPSPAAVTQTLLAFGPLRQVSSRGPPRLA
jgi:hypothetical protein